MSQCHTVSWVCHVSLWLCSYFDLYLILQRFSFRTIPWFSIFFEGEELEIKWNKHLNFIIFSDLTSAFCNLYFRGCYLTSSLTATLSLVLILPLTMIVDVFMKRVSGFEFSTQWSDICACANVVMTRWHACRLSEPNSLARVTNNHTSH